MVCTEANILIKRSMYTLEGNIGYQVKLLSTILQPVLIKKRFPNFELTTPKYYASLLEPAYTNIKSKLKEKKYL